ncbi:hypothetical protein MBLNU459_g2340t1 [Dothideomycetes sp. NU459]
MAHHNEDPVLVYHHQHLGKPVVKDGLAVVSHSVLFDVLTANTHLKLTRKSIDKNARHVDVLQSDLWTEGEKESRRDLPNAGLNVSAVTLTWKIMLERALFGEFKELLILSDRSHNE